MENRFNNRDFEQFVKQNADQYRMFPSEKVWSNIHSTLHVRRRWYGIGIALLLITVAAVTLVMLNHPDKKMPLAQTAPAFNPAAVAIDSKPKPAEVFIAPAKSSVKKAFATIIKNTEQPTIFLSAFNNSTESDYTETAAVNNNTEAAAAVANVTQAEAIAPVGTVHNNNTITVNTKTRTTMVVSPEPAQEILTAFAEKANPSLTETKAEQKPVVMIPNLQLPALDIAANDYKQKRKVKKFALQQIYVTPTITYRDLKENKAFIRSVQTGNAGPLTNVYVPDVNNIVTHKPDLGFQFGAMWGYPLSKNITITGGLQLNISKYDIKAYSHPSEVTTIALSTAAGGSNTVSTFTSYRNIGGFKESWLRNLYVSASVPIGLELKLAKNRKGYIGIGGNVQPAYVIDNKSYLLSTDFKNYAEIPSLIRKWNINTGFEVFAASTTGKVKWRIGPQVRYQTRSSFITKYPVKEHLYDFGIKLGLMLK